MDAWDVIFLSDDDEEIINHLQTYRRRRIVRTRPDYFYELGDTEFLLRYGVSRKCVVIVHDLIEHRIKSRTEINRALSPLKKLLVVLQYYVSGSEQTDAAEFSGISQSSMCIYVRQVTWALAHLSETMIAMPGSENELRSIESEFHNLSKFPRVLGVIGCTNVQIKFRNAKIVDGKMARNGSFSLNVQVMSDVKCKIQNIVPFWPGSTPDRSVFETSDLKVWLEREIYGNRLLIGGESYENKPYLVTPLPNPESAEERLYNESLEKARMTVDKLIKLWKSRFHILYHPMGVKIPLVKKIVLATTVLHNIAIDERDPLPEVCEKEDEFEEKESDNDVPVGDDRTRRNIISEYFRLLSQNEQGVSVS